MYKKGIFFSSFETEWHQLTTILIIVAGIHTPKQLMNDTRFKVYITLYH